MINNRPSSLLVCPSLFQFKLQKMLVANLGDFMQLAARWVAERSASMQPQVGASASAAAALSTPGDSGGVGLAGSSLAAVVRPPGQGVYSYQQIVEEYLKTIQFIAKNDDVRHGIGLLE